MISTDQNHVKVQFDRFDLSAYEVFLKTKQIPETVIDFDTERETYTVTAPVRFASLLGVQSPSRNTADIPTADHLFDYQQYIVEKAFDVRRYAVWADCGLGKTPMQLEWARKVMHRTDRPVLIFAPLHVIPQTIQECQKFYNDEIALTWLKTRAEVIEWCKNPTSFFAITNPQKLLVKDNIANAGMINELRLLGGIVLDESSILKTGGGVIKWNLIKSCRGIEYKLSCTATPAPNDTMEYASQGSFLEKLRSEGEIIWTYFKRDKYGNWEVKPHAQEAFYKFMSDWSIYLRSPARYGWKDNIEIVPPPEFIEHRIPATGAQLSEGGKFLNATTGDWFTEKLGVSQRTKLSQIGKGFIYDGKTSRRIESNKPKFVAELMAKEIRDGRQPICWTIFNAEAGQIEAELLKIMPSNSVATIDGLTKEENEDDILGRYTSGNLDGLISKASLLGYGRNFQNCGAMVYSGWNDSFESWYQSVRRGYRYGQKRSMRVHIPMVREFEGHQYENLIRKAQQFETDTAIQEENYIKAMKGEL